MSTPSLKKAYVFVCVEIIYPVDISVEKNIRSTHLFTIIFESLNSNKTKKIQSFIETLSDSTGRGA